jgi:glycosyltransferase involved in cell wall biosynthesis
LLTVIVPVFNEARTIDELLRRVLAAPFDKQVVVVDDGSTDGTRRRLNRWEGSPQLTVAYHARNRGKGAAVRTGLRNARGLFTLVQDADLEYDPRDYGSVLSPLVEGQAKVVYGSRYLGPNTRTDAQWRFRCGVTLLNYLVRLLYGVRLTDEATCYKAFPTDILRRMELRCERFEFCPEVTAKACRMGLAIQEVPIRYSPRTAKEGKKIGMRDGIAAIRELWKWRNWSCQA